MVYGEIILFGGKKLRKQAKYQMPNFARHFVGRTKNRIAGPNPEKMLDERDVNAGVASTNFWSGEEVESICSDASRGPAQKHFRHAMNSPKLDIAVAKRSKYAGSKSFPAATR